MVVETIPTTGGYSVNRGLSVLIINVLIINLIINMYLYLYMYFRMLYLSTIKALHSKSIAMLLVFITSKYTVAKLFYKENQKEYLPISTVIIFPQQTHNNNWHKVQF